MPDSQSLVALGQQFGISALIFLLFVIYIRNQNNKETKQAADHTTTLHKIIDTLREDKEKDRKVLTDALADNRMNTEMTHRLIEKLNKQDQALSVALDKISRILENRCINQLHHIKQ